MQVRDSLFVSERTSGVNLCGFDVNADDFPRRNRACKPEGDRTRSAADIENAHAGSQMGQEESAFTLGSATCHDTDDGFAIAARVGVSACGAICALQC